MELTDYAKNYCERMFPGQEGDLDKTDPEFTCRFLNFAFDEVVNTGNIEEKTRLLAVLAALLGAGCTGTYRVMLKAALNGGVTPVEVKEMVYQAAAYLGIGRTIDFLHITNEILTEGGIPLPTEGQSQTTMGNRLEMGAQVQVDIFGPGMADFYRSGPEDSRHINRWLADNCFGDYYTRTGLDLKQREMITFCFLAAQGGCEPQLVSHSEANMRIGNDKEFLIGIISQCLPYIGYPRSLNALRCVREAAAKAEAEKRTAPVSGGNCDKLK